MPPRSLRHSKAEPVEQLRNEARVPCRLVSHCAHLQPRLRGRPLSSDPQTCVRRYAQRLSMSAGSSDKDARDRPHRSHSAERWVYVWEIEPWMCWQGLWLGFCSWRTLLPCSPSDADGKSLPGEQTPRLSGARGLSPITFPGSPERWWGDEALKAEAQAAQAPREERHQAACNILALRPRSLFSAGVRFATASHMPVDTAQ